MKLLMIGGTRFSGRAATERALAAGHEVTLFHRGSTGAELFPEAEHLTGNRAVDLSPLAGRSFDAVLDFCGYFPRAVRASTAGIDAGWYGFVSTISVYRDPFPPGGDEDAPVHEPLDPAVEAFTPESYGPCKRACELMVTERFGARAAVVRPGFVVGPHDPTDRFPSLVRRAAAGGQMLAPGPADSWFQFVDARDLGEFLVHLAETGTGGTFNAVHPPRRVTIAEVLEAARAVAGADTTFVWPEPTWLLDALGDGRDAAFPMWAPDDPGFHEVDGARAAAAGLRSRPIADTVRDVWAAAGVAPANGLSEQRERELLARWV
ncbi:MAG: NAD-dependent epimerase/dehydratase family protein [Myxococcota bacterium]